MTESRCEIRTAALSEKRCVLHGCWNSVCHKESGLRPNAIEKRSSTWTYNGLTGQLGTGTKVGDTGAPGGIFRSVTFSPLD